MKRNFSRSNVNESTLNVSQPGRSSFDLSHVSHVTLPLGKYVPINVEKLMPTSVVRGSITPTLQLDVLATPALGRTRLDTHTFAVSARRFNKSFRQFFEGSAAAEVLPTVDLSAVFNRLLKMLIKGNSSATNEIGETLIAVAQFAEDAEYPNTHQVSAYLYDRVLTFYRSIVSSTAQTSDYCYTKDFAAIEYNRILLLRDESFAASRQIGKGVNSSYVAHIAHCIYEIMKPFFGEGSVLDMCGYPYFNRFGAAYQRISNLRGFPFTGGIVDYFTYLFTNFTDAFMSKGVESMSPTVPLDFETIPCLRDESYLRAVYSAWYDGLRNWHVEKRENLLDPDQMDTESVLHTFQLDGRFFAHCYALLVPHFACYSRDFYTTVQTEDVYRYVGSPISQETQDAIGADTIPSDTLQQLQYVINNVLVGGDDVETIFPSGLFKTTTAAGLEHFSTFRSDLQTMRRAGMLERWLARNYFYPDTFSGQLMAHYSVKPTDFAVISSEYIGGNESFLDGKQEVTATGTEDTPAGTRTLVGNMSHSDSFVYNSNGDFVYLVSFASIIPLVTYDCANMHLHEIHRSDMPFPEFANDARIGISSADMMRSMEMTGQDVIGYVPRYYQYRSRGDEAHGRYLNDLRSYVWLHDFYSIGHSSDFVPNTRFYLNQFALTAYNMHIHLPLDAFLGKRQWDDIAYGPIDIVTEVECPLPAAVEFI